MSYILDALRRADADRERERGAVPGLHSRPGAPRDMAGPQRGVPRWLSGGLMGLGLVLLGALGAWWLRPGAVPAVVQMPVQVPAPIPAALPPIAATATAPAPPAVVQPAPALPLRVVVAPPIVTKPQAATASAPPMSQTPAPPLPLPPPLTVARPIPLAQLTPEQRRDWPALVVGGAIYSDNASTRFIMVAGQVVREGEAAAPGVVVERIGPKTVVMRWRDLRVEVPF